MSKGRLIAVVGPSGVGKDSVMAGLVARRPKLHLVCRMITRPAHVGGEAFYAVSDQEFAQHVADQTFALHWQAHGLRYGIAAQQLACLSEGGDALVNLSRGVLKTADRQFDKMIVLSLTTPSSVLVARLQARGRESAEQILARLARSGFALPKGLRVLTVDNSRTLDQTIETILGALYPDSINREIS